MSTKITRVPVGLQSFLGTQAFGKNPDELAQTVAPVLSIDKFLSVQQDEWYVRGMGNFSSDTFVSKSVPENEVWLLRGVGWEHKGGAAGQSYQASVAISNNSNSIGPLNSHPIGNPFLYEVAPAKIWSFEQKDNFILPGGTQISWHVTDVQGAVDFTSNVYAYYLKLKI